MSSNRVIGVIGSGTMGSGIAEAAASAGFVTKVLDIDPDRVRKAYAEIGERLDRRVADGKMSGPKREATVSCLEVASAYEDLADAECVVEAVPEDPSLKRQVLAELERVVSPRALLTTNTSSLAIAELAEGMRHEERFLGMHFFNPAPAMDLVELVRGPATSEQAIVDARAICVKLGKTAVQVKDSPGFIGNRVNRPFYLESQRLVETGEATIGAVDQAVKDVGGLRMGPFELLDLIGLDVSQRVSQSLYDAFGKTARFAPSGLQGKLVSNGHLGRKSGRGFYDYSDGRPMAAYETRALDTSGWRPTPALRAFAESLGGSADRETWIFARIFSAVVNEGARVADTIATPRAVDQVMELGFHYPRGPLAQADHLGLDVVHALLLEFHEATGDERFKPCELIERHVSEGNLGEATARGFLHHSL